MKPLSEMNTIQNKGLKHNTHTEIAKRNGVSISQATVILNKII